MVVVGGEGYHRFDSNQEFSGTRVDILIDMSECARCNQCLIRSLDEDDPFGFPPLTMTHCLIF